MGKDLLDRLLIFLFEPDLRSCNKMSIALYVQKVLNKMTRSPNKKYLLFWSRLYLLCTLRL